MGPQPLRLRASAGVFVSWTWVRSATDSNGIARCVKSVGGESPAETQRRGDMGPQPLCHRASAGFLLMDVGTFRDGVDGRNAVQFGTIRGDGTRSREAAKDAAEIRWPMGHFRVRCWNRTQHLRIVCAHRRSSAVKDSMRSSSERGLTADFHRCSQRISGWDEAPSTVGGGPAGRRIPCPCGTMGCANFGAGVGNTSPASVVLSRECWRRRERHGSDGHMGCGTDHNAGDSVEVFSLWDAVFA